jgi:hypothetical protein
MFVHVPNAVHLSHGALPARYPIALIDEAEIFLGRRSLQEVVNNMDITTHFLFFCSWSAMHSFLLH